MASNKGSDQPDLNHSGPSSSKPVDPAQSASEQLSTPSLISPPITKTPPTDSAQSGGRLRRGIQRNSEPIDPQGLSQALNKLERGGREREHTPGSSPNRKRPRVYGDRFIPNREGRDYSSGFNLLHEDASPATPSKSKKRPSNNEINFQKSEYCHGFTSSCHTNSYDL